MFLCSFAAIHKEILWNGKFLFAFPTAEWEHITHLKLKIIEAEYFTDGRFVGETTYDFLENLSSILVEKINVCVSGGNGETMYDFLTKELKFHISLELNFDNLNFLSCGCIGHIEGATFIIVTTFCGSVSTSKE